MRAIWSGVLIAASTAIGMTDVYAQGIEYGKNDYVKFCVQCHGETGKGDGRFAKSLKRPPGDLTKLSENNGGVCPSARIYDVIDGRVLTRLPQFGQGNQFEINENSVVWVGTFGTTKAIVYSRILDESDNVAS